MSKIKGNPVSLLGRVKASNPGLQSSSGGDGKPPRKPNPNGVGKAHYTPAKQQRKYHRICFRCLGPRHTSHVVGCDRTCAHCKSDGHVGLKCPAVTISAWKRHTGAPAPTKKERTRQAASKPVGSQAPTTAPSPEPAAPFSSLPAASAQETASSSLPSTREQLIDMLAEEAALLRRQLLERLLARPTDGTAGGQTQQQQQQQQQLPPQPLLATPQQQPVPPVQHQFPPDWKAQPGPPPASWRGTYTFIQYHPDPNPPQFGHNWSMPPPQPQQPWVAGPPPAQQYQQMPPPQPQQPWAAGPPHPPPPAAQPYDQRRSRTPGFVIGEVDSFGVTRNSADETVTNGNPGNTQANANANANGQDNNNQPL